MARRSGELKALCRGFGLTEDGTREELMDRIRDFIVQRDKIDHLPQVPNMAAENAKDWLDYDIEKPWRSPKLMAMWNSEDWIVEPKLDGIRVKAHFSASYTQQPRLDSRRRSDTNFLFAEQTENFQHLAVVKPPADTILDGELMPPSNVTKIWNGALWVEGLQICTSIWNSGPETSRNLQQYCYHERSTDPLTAGVDAVLTRLGKRGYWTDDQGNERGCLLQYHAFDLIRYKGEWLHDYPFEYRRKLLEEVMIEIMEQNPNYHIVPQWTVAGGTVIQRSDQAFETGFDRVQRYEIEWEHPDHRLNEYELEIGERKGEGIIFKYRKSPYEYGKRSWSWVKLKKFSEISAFVIGSVPATVGKGWEGMIGAFEVAVMQGDTPVHVASCSSMTLEMRREASTAEGLLNPAFLNRVMEVRYQVMTTRSVRGRHSVMLRWRDDLGPSDCLYEQLVEQPSEAMSE